VQFVEKIFYFCTFKKGYILLKKIVIHNQNLMETILVIKDTFEAMVVDNSHKYLKFRLLFSGIHDCYPPSK